VTHFERRQNVEQFAARLQSVAPRRFAFDQVGRLALPFDFVPLGARSAGVARRLIENELRVPALVFATRCPRLKSRGQRDLG